MPIRLERLKELIREVSAEFILHELSDPRIGFCTVTRVDLTQDLAHCIIHISILGDEVQKRTTLRGLADARGILQSHVAKHLRTRTTPLLEIRLDESIERTFDILDKIREARASDSDGGKAPLGLVADEDSNEADEAGQGPVPGPGPDPMLETGSKAKYRGTRHARRKS